MALGGVVSLTPFQMCANIRSNMTEITVKNVSKLAFSVIDPKILKSWVFSISVMRFAAINTALHLNFSD